MHVLLNPLSLPQRLLSKIFYPPALGILVAALLAIWTIGRLLESKAAAIEFTKTTSNATIEWSVDSSALESTAKQFVKSWKRQAHDHVISHLTAYVYPYCQKAVESWNQSLSTSIHAQKIMYDYMLDVNKTITNTLYDKSKQINESLDALNHPDASQLSVNYWFVSNLFHNVSVNSTKISNLQLGFPVIANSTKLNLPDISIDPLVSKINKIVEQRPERIHATAKLQDNTFSTSLKQHCRVLTAIMVTTYIIWTLGRCFYEWLKFKWETSIFNKHVDLHLYPLDKLEEEAGPITSQQRLRRFAQQLVFTMNNILTYWVSNWIGASKVKGSRTWNRLVNFQWWIWSNTGYFLLILLAAIIHWQICLSMINTRSNQLTALDKSQNQGPHTSTNNNTNNRSVFQVQFSHECHNFELHVFETLNKSIFTQLWSHNGTITTALYNVNEQMNKLVKNVQVASPPQWNNLSLSDLVYPRLAFSNLNSSSASSPLELQLLKNRAVSRHQTTMVSTNNSFFKTFDMQKEQSTTQIHMWTIIGLVVSMSLFYMLGLTVFIRL